jgi:hypothetical protein
MLVGILKFPQAIPPEVPQTGVIVEPLALSDLLQIKPLCISSLPHHVNTGLLGLMVIELKGQKAKALEPKKVTLFKST